mmetsp:Transcript_61428/g.133473  ORF Transcript_61428/g.133473 Transcript_61428/m.133473 type:complete len:200 (+) Transcript_61428:170-769(+)
MMGCATLTKSAAMFTRSPSGAAARTPSPAAARAPSGGAKRAPSGSAKPASSSSAMADVDSDSLVMQGQLSKSPSVKVFGLQRTSSGFMGWTRRWFILTDTRLLYLTSDSGPSPHEYTAYGWRPAAEGVCLNNSETGVRGQLLLSLVVEAVVEEEEVRSSAGLRYPFTVLTTEGRRWTLRAQTRQDRLRWMTGINAQARK